jgi:DNA adenine methylase/adenine-specific DNA-methyltransferase
MRSFPFQPFLMGLVSAERKECPSEEENKIGSLCYNKGRIDAMMSAPVSGLAVAEDLVYSRQDFSEFALPDRVADYPELRYMGSKRRLLPWIHGVLRSLPFETAADPFLGSGCVAYLLKAMGKRVVGSDFLNFPTVLATATVANNTDKLDDPAIRTLLSPHHGGANFIERTFDGIFFNTEDLRFLDRVSANMELLERPAQQALARAALIRSCLKKQPRGVFTVSGDLSRYDDGRRDLRLSIEEHFIEQVAAFNRIVFDNGRKHIVQRGDVFSRKPKGIDLVYLDPPYVPRSDDNCYVKRYHFLEGLSCYWKGQTILQDTKVKKIAKPYTPFSYRKTAVDAFDRLFELYRHSIIVLSYSSNGFPDREQLESLMRRYKKSVTAYEKQHRYHFGTHSGVSRAEVYEYLIVGQ